MGKLMNRLTKQLSTEYKEDAEECIKIYNKLKEMNNGHVWSSTWQPLTEVVFKGYAGSERRYKLSSVGKVFLKGLEEESYGASFGMGN